MQIFRKNSLFICVSQKLYVSLRPILLFIYAMKKFALLLVGICCALSAMSETEFTFSTSTDMSQTKDGITLTIAKGNGGTAPTVTKDYETQLPEMRVYLDNTITLSSSTPLTNIQLVCAKSSASNKEYAGLSASTGTIDDGGTSTDKTDWKVDAWTGSATSVVFTLTGKGQRRIQRIVVDGEPIVITPDEANLPTEEDLKPDFVYPEPTIVDVPDTTIFKKEYAFIDNNILVHCEMGSIMRAEEDSNPDDDEDDSHPPFFNCNQDYHITFTAAQNIKGIAIDGYVRKAFYATCDHGTMTYMTDPDYEGEGAPVIVIQNVDNKSVTIFCPKQFRCYKLKVYFKENPEAIDMQGIEDVQTSEVRVLKVLRDGKIVIVRDDREFTILGTEIR